MCAPTRQLRTRGITPARAADEPANRGNQRTEPDAAAAAGIQLSFSRSLAVLQLQQLGLKVGVGEQRRQWYFRPLLGRRVIFLAFQRTFYSTVL